VTCSLRRGRLRHRVRQHLDRERRVGADLAEEAQEADEVELALARRDPVDEAVRVVVGVQRDESAVVDLDPDDALRRDRTQLLGRPRAALVVPHVDAQAAVRAPRPLDDLERRRRVRDVRERQELERHEQAVIGRPVAHGAKGARGSRAVPLERPPDLHVAGARRVRHRVRVHLERAEPLAVVA